MHYNRFLQDDREYKLSITRTKGRKKLYSGNELKCKSKIGHFYPS